MSKNTVEEEKHWRIQWGLVLWPKGPWDVNVTFLLYHVRPLKPDVSIHKASLKPWLNLVKFLGKDNYAENYQTLDSPGVRPCKLEPENIKDWNYDVSHTRNTKIIGVTRGGIHHKISLIWNQAELWKQLPNIQGQRPLILGLVLMLSGALKLVLFQIYGKRKDYWHPLYKLECFLGGGLGVWVFLLK